jgi:hypothetical protein
MLCCSPDRPGRFLTARHQKFEVGVTVVAWAAATVDLSDYGFRAVNAALTGPRAINNSSSPPKARDRACLNRSAAV